jgi:dipeptidyl aminopeptidase/acylaminoacyl peptidase
LTVVRWRSREAALEGLLATPRQAQPPFPMVVEIHGGPSSSLLATRMPPLHEWTARGFAAFAPEYRASGIAGRDAMLAAADWRPGLDGGTDLHDILDGVENLVERGVADPERLD